MTSEKTGVRRAEIGSAIAIIFSVLAVIVSFYQARIAEKQAHASVWPYLSIGYNLYDGGPSPGFAFTVDNPGLGPAVIESVVVLLDGVPRKGWSEVTAALGIKPPFLHTVSSVHGHVLPPSVNRETTIEAIHISSIPEAKVLYRANDRITISICYCSVYDECWIAQFRKTHPERVSGCSANPAVEFRD
jgi:hypothetical protein